MAESKGEKMSKEELLELKHVKQKELDEIEKQLDDIYDKEFLEADNYVGKFYNLNNSNIYFHVTGYNPNQGQLYGTEIILSPEGLDTYHEECKEINKEKYKEVSEENMKEIIKTQIDYLVEEFMR